MAAVSPATLVFLLSLICVPSRFLTGALPPPPPTPAVPVMLAPTTPPKPVMPAPTTPSKPVTPPPTTPPKPVMPPPAMPPKPVMPPPATSTKPVAPPPTTPFKPVLPPPATAPRPVMPPGTMPPSIVLPPALAPALWEEPGYESRPIPEPVRKACRRTPFPDLCGRVLAFMVDPQRSNDTRWLAETSLRVAIEAGTGLAAFGWVNVGGAKSGTRLRLCVRDCTVRVDLAVKNLTESSAAMKRGEIRVAAYTLGEAAKGCAVCWGSCARFTGEVMHVMIKRARQFEHLVMIAGAIVLMIL